MIRKGFLQYLILEEQQVKVLRSMRKLRVDDVVIGQYKSHTKGSVSYPGYTDDKTVPKDSLTPTFAAAALFIDNARWDGVPFLMKAGKALHNRRLEKSAGVAVLSFFTCFMLHGLISGRWFFFSPPQG